MIAKVVMPSEFEYFFLCFFFLEFLFFLNSYTVTYIFAYSTPTDVVIMAKEEKALRFSSIYKEKIPYEMVFELVIQQILRESFSLLSTSIHMCTYVHRGLS